MRRAHTPMRVSDVNRMKNEKCFHVLQMLCDWWQHTICVQSSVLNSSNTTVSSKLNFDFNFMRYRFRPVFFFFSQRIRCCSVELCAGSPHQPSHIDIFLISNFIKEIANNKTQFNCFRQRTIHSFHKFLLETKQPQIASECNSSTSISPNSNGFERPRNTHREKCNFLFFAIRQHESTFSPSAAAIHCERVCGTAVANRNQKENDEKKMNRHTHRVHHRAADQVECAKANDSGRDSVAKEHFSCSARTKRWKIRT